MLYDAAGRVRGVATGNMGVTKAGEEGPNFQPGMELHAKLTLFAEGCRGSLTKTLMERFKLRDGVQPQTYGLGVKELWEVEPAQHVTGKVIHTIGWPVDTHTYGGSWLYMFGENLVSVGFVVGLDYENPHLSPFEEMQRYKTHPAIRPILEGGRRIAYGARALSEGGFQSIPKLVFPGGALIGDTAGFLNVPKIKGTHTAMKSGMVAAEAAFDALKDGAEAPELTAYPERLKRSWLWDELRGVRNIRPAFHWGLWPAMAYSALDTYVLRGQRTLDARAPGRPHDPAARRRLRTDRLPAPGRQADLRPPLLGVPVQHQPRGGPAGASAAQGPERRGADQPRRSTTARSSATARPGSTSTSPAPTAPATCRSTRRTASTARPATSRTRPRTSTGSPPRAAAGRTISAGCERRCGARSRRMPTDNGSRRTRA